MKVKMIIIRANEIDKDGNLYTEESLKNHANALRERGTEIVYEHGKLVIITEKTDA